MAAGELDFKEKEEVKAEKVEKETKKESKKEEVKEQTTNGLAIAGLVCSLIFFIPLTGLVGLILSVIALSQQKSGIYSEDSKTMAIVGVIISSLRLFLTIIIVIGFLLILAGLGTLIAALVA